MKKALSTLCAVLLSWMIVSAPAHAQQRFMFGLVSNTFTHTEHESLLIKSLTETDAANFPFVVVNGIKSSSESCSDGLYQQRYDLFNLSETAVMLSITGADWADCFNKDKVSIATDRLTHIRELFFPDTVSLGQHNISVLRQSILPQFRNYAENTRWESHGILFATINVPAPNNHWIIDGGRNSEFEDRLIANKDWLHRLFLLATVKKSPGIVIFSDADFLTSPPQHLSLLHEKRDGFVEMRELFHKLAAGYKGRVLLVHSDTGDNTPPVIRWDKNVGHVAAHAAWMSIHVNLRATSLFSLQTLHDIPKIVPTPMSYHELPDALPSP